jgi:hypothetical protein
MLLPGLLYFCFCVFPGYVTNQTNHQLSMGALQCQNLSTRQCLLGLLQVRGVPFGGQSLLPPVHLRGAAKQPLRNKFARPVSTSHRCAHALAGTPRFAIRVGRSNASVCGLRLLGPASHCPECVVLVNVARRHVSRRAIVILAVSSRSASVICTATTGFVRSVPPRAVALLPV